MAKRKRRAGGGSKLRPVINYQDDEYTPYIYQIESGVLMAWAIDTNLRDGDVRKCLRELIKNSAQWTEFLTQEDQDNQEEKEPLLSKSKQPILQSLIISNLQQGYQKHGELSAEALTGVLKVINGSVGAMNRGMRGQEYLNYMKGFMEHLGGVPQVLSAEDVEHLGLMIPEEPLEGEYDEIE